MAGFLQKAKAVATEAAVAAKEKTQETVETAKLNSKIREEKEKIENIKLSIAEYVIGLCEEGNFTDEAVLAKKEEIAACLAEINRLEEEKRAIKED